jgi:hypothetical protein
MVLCLALCISISDYNKGKDIDLSIGRAIDLALNFDFSKCYGMLINL